MRRKHMGWAGLRAGILLGASVLCAGLSSPGAQPAPAASSTAPQRLIRQYNILGATGLRVSDIGFGAGSTVDAALVEYALDMGINYFDTAEGYGRGASETAIGQVAARRRPEMVICTKLALDGNSTRQDVFTRLDACLQRLQTDYVDILMIHAGAPEALNNSEIFAAFDQLKKEGKIHFTGASHHGPDMVGALRPLIAAGKLDVILCSYDPIGEPELPAMLAEARERGVGLVAMKVLSSARKTELPEFTSGEYPFHLAALRWALRTSGMHTVLTGLNVMDQIDEYAQASGAGSQ